MVQFQVSNVGTGKTLLFGDSNTEAFWWNINDNCWYINAGMGGALIHDLAGMAPQVAAWTAPRTVHLMIGTNDVFAGTPANSAMSANIDAILGAFPNSKIVIWAVPPYSSSLSGGSISLKNSINTLLSSKADNNRIWYETWWQSLFTDANGYSTNVLNPPYMGLNAPAMQADGLHMGPSAQSARFYRMNEWRNYIHTQTGMTCQ